MAKPRTLFNQTYNECLDLLASGQSLPSELKLSTLFKISRTTVRSVLVKLKDAGLIDDDRRHLRPPEEDDYFTSDEIGATADLVERWFMQKILVEDASPGRPINELEIARETGVSTGTVREFLIRFSRFGLIEKRRNSNWTLKGFTPEFALELADVREMFESRSARLFVALPKSHPSWRELKRIETEHLRMRANSATLERDFSSLDEQFHRLIHTASQNRFIIDFYDVIAMVFHYHYQWNKVDEQARNAVAIEEHLAYIAALTARDARQVEKMCQLHLRSARDTLMSSVRASPKA